MKIAKIILLIFLKCVSGYIEFYWKINVSNYKQTLTNSLQQKINELNDCGDLTNGKARNFYAYFPFFKQTVVFIKI